MDHPHDVASSIRGPGQRDKAAAHHGHPWIGDRGEPLHRTVVGSLFRVSGSTKNEHSSSLPTPRVVMKASSLTEGWVGLHLGRFDRGPMPPQGAFVAGIPLDATVAVLTPLVQQPRQIRFVRRHAYTQSLMRLRRGLLHRSREATNMASTDVVAGWSNAFHLLFLSYLLT